MPNKAPHLAPPGAGIPFLQRMALRYFIRPLYAARTPFEETERRFKNISESIFGELSGLTEHELSTPILIDPLQGLEDNSRYWSVAMTLDHIVIVGDQVVNVAIELSRGSVPSGKADTATVKPRGSPSTSECLASFRRLCDTTVPALRSQLVDIDSRLTFDHPWFGSMTAREWHWLLATHHRLHLKQIRAIKSKMAPGRKGPQDPH